MLTDRQQKFKQEIENLLLLSSSATFLERKYLKVTAEELRKENIQFKSIIDKLILNLKALEKYPNTNLTVGTNSLVTDLVSTYGEPSDTKRDTDWQIRDPNFVFIGGFEGWRETNQKQPSVFKSVCYVFLSMILVLGILYVVFPWFQLKFGNNYELVVILFLAFVCLLLAFFGSFKRNKKKHK